MEPKLNVFAILVVSFLCYIDLAHCQVTAAQPANPSIKGEPCIRLFHSKGDVGCRGIASAPLYLIETDDDISDFVSQSDKKTVLLTQRYFNRFTLDKLKKTNNVAALVFLTDQNSSYSPASVFPQGRGTPDAALNPFGDTSWNPNGLDFLDESYPFPIMVANQDNSKLIADAQQNMKNQGTLDVEYTADFNHYFGPDNMTSLACLKFKDIYGNVKPRCEPIGGQSTWGYLGSLSRNSSAILVMAAMDARATSPFLATGANSALSGLVALMVAVDALKNVKPSLLQRPIVFAAFQAERYGFVGSRRFIEDLKNFQCHNKVSSADNVYKRDLCLDPLKMSLDFTNLNLENIKYALAIDQVGRSVDKNMYIHTNPYVTKSELAQVIESSPSASGKYKVGNTKSVPPTSLTSFIHEFSTLDAAVIGGYQSNFSGVSYLGDNDRRQYLQDDQIANVAQVVVDTLLNLAMNNLQEDKDAPKVTVDTKLVSDLLDCFSSNWSCDLMKNHSSYYLRSMANYTDRESYEAYYSMPNISFYASTHRQVYLRNESGLYSRSTVPWAKSNALQVNPTPMELFIRSFFAHAAGWMNKIGKTCEVSMDCSSSSEFPTECVYPGECVASHSFFHDALSPGLKATNELRVYDIVNSSMPIWAEPVWTTLEAYEWPNGGRTIGWVSLGIGIIIFACSFVAANFFLRKFRKNKLL